MFKNKFLNSLLNLDFVLTGITFIALVSITFVGVIMRYFLNNPLVWLEEVQLMCFVWIVFFGSGAAFRTGNHVAIEMIVDKLPSGIKKIVEVLIYITVIIVLAYFFMKGSDLVKQLAETDRTTNIFKIPYKIIYSAFPIGCILMIINYTIVSFLTIFNSNKDEKVGEA